LDDDWSFSNRGYRHNHGFNGFEMPILNGQNLGSFPQKGRAESATNFG
jgi:hypothetical protein